ncbi:MAG: exonuclease SbcCD subunit D [Anaerocolumna sp.]
MKLLHIADLHIGKRVNEYSMIEDQQYILEQIIHLAIEEQTQGILIAGDIYDKSLPPAEAVELLDEFLTKLNQSGQAVFMISGNHDSPERIGFGSRLLEHNGLYIAGVFEGKLNTVTLEDEHGSIHIHMLPFIKPALLRPFYDEIPDSYDEAVKLVIENANIDDTGRNILLSHQFVIHGVEEPERSDSEHISVGGIDHVDSSAYKPFDYVALGHLHRAQQIGRKSIRYAGSPLKYSFSEALNHKSVTVLDLGLKGEITIHTRELVPLRDLREIKGPIEELLKIGKEDPANLDYMHITLTDEEDIYDAIGQLRQVYPNLMILDFLNTRTSQSVYGYLAATEEAVKKTPLELFDEFYQLQNNIELSEKQLDVMKKVMED